jgi:hypothetical protein
MPLLNILKFFMDREKFFYPHHSIQYPCCVKQIFSKLNLRKKRIFHFFEKKGFSHLLYKKFEIEVAKERRRE